MLTQTVYYLVDNSQILVAVVSVAAAWFYSCLLLLFLFLLLGSVCLVVYSVLFVQLFIGGLPG